MKKFVPFLAVLFLTAFGAQAANTSEERLVPNYVRGYGNSFIFVEDGITFSVYPDGEFDFYIDNRVNVGVGARIGNVGITFNSGFDYNPFVQYDDYGAVIQVENIPIFYDYYGRVSQIGSVDVWYRNGRVRRLGGLNVYWNGGVFSHYTGFINVYNRYYVYRPWHRWFARPAIGFCNVWTSPYRRYYNPVRYTWYRPYRHNFRRAYAKIGREYRYDRAPRRASIYRNDRRVAVRDDYGRRNADFARSNRSVTRRGEVSRSNRDGRRVSDRGTVSRSNRSVSNRDAVSRSNPGVSDRGTVSRSNRGKRSVAQRGTVSRSNRENYRSSGNRKTVERNSTDRRSTAHKGNSVAKRSNRATSVTKRSVTRSPQGTKVTKRQVTQSPRKRTVSKKTTTYRKPQGRSVVSNRSTGKRTQSVQKRSAPQRKTVSRSPSSRRGASTTSRTARSSRRQ